MIKRGEPDPVGGEEEAEEEELDESTSERIEEARSVLEKLEEIRRDAKDGKNDFVNEPLSTLSSASSTGR